MNTVNSVSEYLEQIKSIERIHILSYSVSSNTFFRGQANSKWTISPSLYRQGLFKSENLLLTNIKHICPDEIPEHRFDALVKMQHYGMPTRLLDTTTNPLVALYFACENIEEINEDGAVYVFPNLPVHWSTDPLVELIMDFVFDYYPEKVYLEQMLKIAKEKYANAVHRLMPDDINSLLHYLMIPAFAVMPARTNKRIMAQDGAFFIFGMTFRDYEVSRDLGTLGRVYYNFDPVVVDTPQELWKTAEMLVIPANAKEQILKELDICGINKEKLYPDLSHRIEYTVEAVRKYNSYKK